MAIDTVEPLKKINIGRTTQIMETSCNTIRELCQRKGYTDQQINKNNAKFEIGKPVMVKSHACHTFQMK